MASPVSVSTLLEILTIALAGLSAVPATAEGAAIASVFVKLITTTMQAYQQATGQPLDLTKIPFEQPVP